MSDLNVGELYDLYVKAFTAGDVDPGPFTSQVEGEDRTELETMIENFLVTTPSAEWDEAAYLESISLRMAPEVAASLSGSSGELPEVLKGLRVRLRIKVSAVVAQLAEMLDAKGREEEEQVADYYHQLEYGTLPARTVSDRVFEALGRIYEVPAAKLRAAGEALGPQHDHPGGPVYARVAGSLSDKGQASPSFPSVESKKQYIEDMREKKRNRIDDLFLGESG